LSIFKCLRLDWLSRHSHLGCWTVLEDSLKKIRGKALSKMIRIIHGFGHFVQNTQQR
jgi:hypothetical protein